MSPRKVWSYFFGMVARNPGATPGLFLGLVLGLYLGHGFNERGQTAALLLVSVFGLVTSVAAVLLEGYRNTRKPTLLMRGLDSLRFMTSNLVMFVLGASTGTFFSALYGLLGFFKVKFNYNPKPEFYPYTHIDLFDTITG